MAKKPNSEELRFVFRQCRGYFVTAGVFSLALNLLYLAGPLYMLQVYDRVVTSGSLVTLAMLTVALVLAFAALAGLDMVRSRVLSRASVRLDRLLAGRVVAATVERSADTASRSQPLRDFDTFRQFVTGPGIHALFDLPWAPIYIAAIFLLHPWLGFFAIGCAVILIVLALINEVLVRGPSNEASAATVRNYSFTEMGLRNAEVVRAMGMMGGLLERWGRDRRRMLERQMAASDRGGTMGSLIKFLRMSMQSIILGLGALLVIERLTTGGAMFAASMLLGRALQPIEMVVGSWRNLLAAIGAYLRVRELLLANPPPDALSLALPRPSGRLSVEALHYSAPGNSKLILRNIGFAVDAGQSIGVIGPSGTGKSTLARLVIGIQRPSMGVVRLDGADVSTWPRESLGQHIGYLPQDVELFGDTVAANIARFTSNADAAVIQAAKMAGVHEMILRLPKGYDTQVGEGGSVLSGGYRQRIGLARAVFGNPSLVLLDEPSSNLDTEGDQALIECLNHLKQLRTTVIVISHRPATLATVDKILILRDGAIEVFGDRAEIVAKLNKLSRVPPIPLNQAQPGAATGS